MKNTQYYGLETKKSLENFPVFSFTVDLRIIYALAEVKKAAAKANAQIGNISQEICDAICSASDEVIAGKLDDQFVTSAIQGGAGTSINMNVNEVIANRASEILGKEFGYVSDLEHVNFAQSTNDTVPTAIKIASYKLLEEVISELELLGESFAQKGKEFADVLKIGRTHLQDAVPVSLGQEFSAYSACAFRGANRLKNLLQEGILRVNMGGTAIGSAIGSSKAFIEHVVRELRDITQLPIESAENLVDATQNLDVFTDISGRVKSVFSGLSKIANDLRMMSAGPVGNLREINLPERQKGSSIMPGKVNPVIPELVNQVFFQIVGNDATITEAVAAGQFELNVMGSVLAFNLIQSLDLAKNSLRLLRTLCIDGITANDDRCSEYLEKSFCMVTALNPYIGYYKATEIAKESIKTGKSIREVALEKGVLTEEELNTILDASKMITPK